MTLKLEDGVLTWKDKSELVNFIKASAGVADIDYSMDTFWLIICAGLVFLMQVGSLLLDLYNIVKRLNQGG
jgi:hypothetical protein